jgi:hypothetical protein
LRETGVPDACSWGDNKGISRRQRRTMWAASGSSLVRPGRLDSKDYAASYHKAVAAYQDQLAIRLPFL